MARVSPRPLLLPFLLLLALAPAAPAAEPPAPDPVERLRERLGAAKLASRRHLRWSGETVLDKGAAGQVLLGTRIEGAWHASGRGWVASETPEGRTMLGFDGSRVWQRRADGRVRVLPASEQRRAKSELMRLLPGCPFVPGFPARVTARAGEADLFDVVPDEGEPFEVHLVPETGLPSWSPASGSGRFQWTRWTEVDGIPLPAEVATVSGGRALLTTQGSFAFDGDVPPRFFERPPRDFRFEREGGTTILPFVGGALFPVVEGRIGAQKVRLLLDLGSPVSRLSAEAAARAGAPKGAKGVTAAVLLLGLELPNVPFRVEPAAVADLVARTDEPLDGTLGADVLLRFHGVFDLERGRARLSDPDGNPIPMGGEVLVPLRESAGLPVLPAAAGGGAFPAVVDPTIDETLRLPAAVAARLGLSGGREVRTAGPAQQLGVLGDFSLGDNRFTGAVARLGVPVAAGEEGFGRLGLAAFGGGYFVWEPELERFRWKRGEREPRDPLSRGGLDLERRGGHLVVSAIVPGGPADRLGLALGDRVVSLAGSAGATTSIHPFRTLLARAAATRLEIAWQPAAKGAKGKKGTLVLGDLAPLMKAKAP